MDFPRAPIERIMRKAGADRVSQGAVNILKDSVESLAKEIASDSVKISEKEGRKEISKKDIRAACE